jgi:hypothetical protein
VPLPFSQIKGWYLVGWLDLEWWLHDHIFCKLFGLMVKDVTHPSIKRSFRAEKFIYF